VLIFVVDDDNTDHIVSVQLDGVESMAQFLDSHNPDDVRRRFSSLKISDVKFHEFFGVKYFMKYFVEQFTGYF